MFWLTIPAAVLEQAKVGDEIIVNGEPLMIERILSQPLANRVMFKRSDGTHVEHWVSGVVGAK